MDVIELGAEGPLGLGIVKLESTIGWVTAEY